MVSTVALKCIDGVLKKVQTITYSSGQTVERIFSPEQVIPEEVRPVAPAQDLIMHREEELYRFHFGMTGM